MVPEESIGYTTLDAPLDKINLHIRGGYILPTQKEELNTRLRYLESKHNALHI